MCRAAVVLSGGEKGCWLAETLYDVLCVAPDASFEELRRAYRDRAKLLHPDRLAHADAAQYERAVRAMQHLNEAWEVLRDPDRRQGYDRAIGLRRVRSRTDARGRRVVAFPFHSLGELYVRPQHVRRGALSSPPREQEAVWMRIGAARGQVRVPASHDLKLVVGRSASFDLAALGLLHPGDLQVLDLSAVAATGDDDLAYAVLEGLVGLSLAGTAVTDRGVRLLADLPHLAELSLARTAITDAGMGYLRPLLGLRDLDLSGTKVEGPGLQHARSLRALRRLRLAETPIGNGWVPQLFGLRLRWLDLTGTRVSFENVLRLKSSMPGCLVSCSR
jgi:hypothetical protein